MKPPHKDQKTHILRLNKEVQSKTSLVKVATKKKLISWFCFVFLFLNDFVIDIMSKVLLHCFPFNYRYCIPVDCCQMLLFFIKIEKKKIIQTYLHIFVNILRKLSLKLKFVGFFVVKPSKPAPKQALRKLLNRIRSQRNDWTEPSHTSAAEPPAVLTDEIPERDTSIDTGSLTSVEKSKLFPSAPGKSARTSAFLFKEKKKPFDSFRYSENKKALRFT